MNTETKVKDFYSSIGFPGTYTRKQLEINELYCNPYLKFYNRAVRDCKTAIDIGCGTGLIANFLAVNNPSLSIDAIDFSESIHYAEEFSAKNYIKNVNYSKQDFLKYKADKEYDVVICTGVLHHMPKYVQAVDKIKNLSTKRIVIGIYNTYAKRVQKTVNLNYQNEIYRLDQEDVPFETSFTNKELLLLFKEYRLKSVYPSINNRFVNFKNLFNYKNGGLTLYEFEC